MKRIGLLVAVLAVMLCSSTARAQWVYPVRVRTYYAAPVVVASPYVWAAPAYYAPPVYAAPVYTPSMYATAYASPSAYAAAPVYAAPVYVAPVYRGPVVTPRRVYYPGEPIRNTIKFIVP